MRITKAVKLHLKDDAGVAALVGERVYLRRAPQKAGFPRVVVSIASVQWVTRSQDDKGDAVKVRVQIDSLSKNEDQVDAVAEAVANAVDGYTGTMQGVVVRGFRQEDERDNYEQLDDASDEGAHRITQDYEVYCNEP